MQNYILDSRLSAAYGFVPDGARLVDVGSDHAYLPIQLALDGKIECALASDINDGPVEAAKKNIKSYGVENTVFAKKADGLCGAMEFAPNCITILGMGGELIVKIIDGAKWVKRENLRLILQPMTHSEILSKYLCDNGFAIRDEAIVRDGERTDRIYRILVAEFDGRSHVLSEAEHYIGSLNVERRSDGVSDYAERIRSVLMQKVDGKRKGGLDCSEEDKLIREMEDIIALF